MKCTLEIKIDAKNVDNHTDKRVLTKMINNLFSFSCAQI